jgi:hypothetical protein
MLTGQTVAASSEGSSQSDTHLKRFDGVENVCECRRGSWRYLGLIGVVNVVIATVKQV